MGCTSCQPYNGCVASTYTPPSEPKPDEILFSLSDDAETKHNVQAWKSVPVCGSVGAIQTHVLGGTGCLTAASLCCGGKELQCLLDENDYSKSAIASITVPCGATVEYGYVGQCEFDPVKQHKIVGSGIPEQLTCSQKNDTVCPYSFKVSLTPGYECNSKGQLVVSTSQERPSCSPTGPNDPVSYDRGEDVQHVSDALSGRSLVILFVAGSIIVLLVAYVITNRSSNTLLTVGQIVQKAGIDRHLVVPGHASR